MNREFVQLSHTLKLSEATMFSLGNWFVSEKLDGMRCLWLPETRGQQVSKLPFANLDKDRAGAGNRTASGLWSRYAKPIWCPPSFTEGFPDYALDGELWTGHNEFQRLMTIVKEKYPGPGWQDVKFRVFDSPSPDMIYRDGKIHNGQLKKQFRGVWAWVQKELPHQFVVHNDTFEHTWHRVLKTLDAPYLVVHPQEQLTWKHSDAVERIRCRLDEVLLNGGEGLIVRAPHAIWEPIRSKMCLKVKPSNEAEGTVIGYTPGVGRLEGMIGSLTVRSDLEGKVVVFGLSGLSDAERYLNLENTSDLFPVGTIVSYLYREITDDGQPREARFLRVRSDHGL